jgi:hypothetical protein
MFNRFLTFSKFQFFYRIKITIFSLLLIFLSGASAFSETSEADPAPPLGSWENWIRETLKGISTPRPDGLAKMAPLPTWVDCHISWWMDRPRKEDTNLKIPSEIILRASPKICEGQLEQWAH